MNTPIQLFRNQYLLYNMLFTNMVIVWLQEIKTFRDPTNAKIRTSENAVDGWEATYSYWQ